MAAVVCTVPGALHGGDQLGGRRAAGQACHLRPLDGEVHLGPQHSGHAQQSLLDAGDARGAGHAVEAQADRFARDGVAGLFDRIDQRVRRQRLIALYGRAFRCEVDVRRMHAGCPGQRLLDSRDATRAGHAGDGQVERRFRGDFGVHAGTIDLDMMSESNDVS
jgi:hypothetical protein